MATSGEGAEETMASSKQGARTHIQPIDRVTTHKICSGQVILSLATAVKELVENSLDAGATTVEIRLKEHGSELIEVSDNGSGVAECNFEGIALKHHTSKLKYFSDLTSVETFGFRGEALSSLCALADVIVLTKHKDAAIGTKIQLDREGKIVKRTPCARQVGTTVTIQQLFSALPVRHKELLRNIKREFQRTIQVLTAYCLLSTGIKISCTNQVGRGQRTVVVSCQGLKTVKENIITVFGLKQMDTLLEVKQSTPSAELLQEMGLSDTVMATFTLEGYISSCNSGSGRSSTDRQFYFINGRPSDPLKVAKMVNEVYHYFNRNQYPFVFLHIRTASGENVDINVTPDKRTIMVAEEKLLLATVKASMMCTFEGISSVYLVQNIPTTSREGEDHTSESPSQKHERSFSLQKFNLRLAKSQSGVKKDAGLQQKSVKRFCSPLTTNTSSPAKKVCDSSRTDSQSSGYGSGSLDGMDEQEDVQISEDGDNESQDITPMLGRDMGTSTHRESKVPLHVISKGLVHNFSEDQANTASEKPAHTDFEDTSHTASEHPSDTASEGPAKTILKEPVCNSDSIDVIKEKTFHLDQSPFKEDHLLSNVKEAIHLGKEKDAIADVTVDLKTKIFLKVENFAKVKSSKSTVKQTACTPPRREVTVQGPMQRRSMDVNFSLSAVTKQFSVRATKKAPEKMPRRFRAGINPAENKSAEEELTRQISKPMFSKMDILGQFNLGFIITKLGSDLFMIDQHASDEKYNFEDLQATCMLQSQKLLSPQNLELTVANEAVLLDNLEIFQHNGFEFNIKEAEHPGHRVSLTSVPISHGWTFGKEDVDELIFMLQDAPGTLCRPTRVRAMFASRACRKSVMIGKALNYREMRRLVDHMGEMSQPWNCPHGRPTMRHLINLDFIR